jgi:acetolactate synthase-1/2/3 large subunit
LHELTKGRDTYIVTDVGQHQMWAAQFCSFAAPRRFMTSGGLGTMGYGTPAAVGVQVAHPHSLVVNISGDMSFKMMNQEIETAVHYGLPIKVFIINNNGSGMVVQWQNLLHEGRLAHSRVDGRKTDFVKLAEAYGATGLRCDKPEDLDAAIVRMIETPGPVVLDVTVDDKETCLPMIPSGKPHNEMLLGDSAANLQRAVEEEGRAMV